MRAVLIPLALASATPAHAHGLWGHIHVTGWAVENMPDDELRQFLLEPEVFNALLFGATFADTGYALDDPASRAYSEHTHWEPFVEDYVQWIQENDPPPWKTVESRKRVAFLIGAASHGLQDEIFDTLFLSQVEQRDGVGQDATDPGTDGFLALDDHIRFIPERDIPMDTLLELYAGLDQDVTEEIIDQAVNLVTGVYINDKIGIAVATALGAQYEEQMPWGRDHYMDAEIPGSLQSEIYPTLRYQQAIWARLHGDLPPDDAVVYAFPEAPRRLLSGDAATVDSWVTVVFGAGVAYEGDLLTLTTADGTAVPSTQSNTRWGADPSRLVRLTPSDDLTPGAWYQAHLRAGATLVNGDVTTAPWALEFQVACLTDGDPDCPDLGDIPVAHTDGVHDDPVDTGGDTEDPGDTDDTAASDTDEPDTDGDTGAPPGDDPDATETGAAAKGCGCVGGAAPPVGWVALALGLPLIRRRRRTG